MGQKDKLQQEAEEYAVYKRIGSVVYRNADVKKGFIAGANWQRYNIWHEANEEPKKYSSIAITLKDSDCIESIYYSMYVPWQMLVKIYTIEKWAYMSDLHPDIELK